MRTRIPLTDGRRLVVVRKACDWYCLVWFVEGQDEPLAASDERFRRSRDAFAFALRNNLGVAFRLDPRKKA